MIQKYLDQISRALEHLIEVPYLWFAFLVIVLLIVLWFLIARRETGPIVAFDSATGDVKVSRQAIHELAQRTCNSMGSVGKCLTRVHTRSGILNVEVRIRLIGGSRLNDVSTELQTRLTQALQENLGIERLGNIVIIVTGFIGDPLSTAQPTAESADEAYASMTEPAEDEDRV